MKNTTEGIQKRKNKILALLQEHQSQTVLELAVALNTSAITIRRDLATLDRMGVVRRFHGGAEKVANVDDYTEENRQLDCIKLQLAKKAASFIQENDTVFINTSSTALLTLSHTEDKRLTVITNNVKVANMDHNPHSTIILSGGEIRFPKEALVGDIAIDSFSKMTADVCIIGCSGLTAEDGITTPIFHEAKINRLIIDRTKGLKIVVADYRKIGKTSNFLSGHLAEIDYLITDSFVDQTTIEQIESQGVTVIQIPI